MNGQAEADRGREETGHRLLLVSVLVTCVGPLAPSDWVKGGPKLPASKVRAVAQQSRRSCTIHCPQTPRVPGGETIDTAACTVPRAFPRRTCVSSRGQELELAPEPVRSSRPAARTLLRNLDSDTRTSREGTTTPVGLRDPTNGGSRRVRGAAPARRFE